MMARPRRIGVLTFHRCINYGSYWQARCLVDGLLARGHDAELLDHHCDEVMSAELRCALQPKLPERSPRQEIRAYAAKVRRFCEPQGHQVSRAALTWSRGRMGNLLDRAIPPPER